MYEPMLYPFYVTQSEKGFYRFFVSAGPNNNGIQNNACASKKQSAKKQNRVEQNREYYKYCKYVDISCVFDERKLVSVKREDESFLLLAYILLFTLQRSHIFDVKYIRFLIGISGTMHIIL